MQYIAYFVIALLVIVIIALLAFRSSKIPINPIDNWKSLHKMLSVQLAALSATMGSLIPIMDQLNQSKGSIEAIASFHALTSSTAYQMTTSVMAALVIVARAWKQGRLQNTP